MKIALITHTLFVLVVIPVANSLTEDDITVGEKYPIIADGLIGCVDSEQLSTILSYLRDGDNVAYQKAVLNGVLDGSVILFEKGQIVKVIENKIWWNSFIKVRPMGETQEYWTGYVALTG
jgi:hypothetical protein